MSLEVPCPNCQSILKAPEGMTGKKARCKRCQHSFRIPGAEKTSNVDSVGDSTHLSVVADAPFAFDTTPVSAGPSAVSHVSQAPAPVDDNPFAIPTANPTSDVSESPKSTKRNSKRDSQHDAKSRSRGQLPTKGGETTSAVKKSSYRDRGSSQGGEGGRSRKGMFLLAGLLCVSGAAGGYFAVTEYMKSQPSTVGPQAANSPTSPPTGNEAATTKAVQPVKSKPEPTPNSGETSAAQPKTGEDRKTNIKPSRSGPKVIGGLKLPAFADKAVPFEKPTAVIPLDHPARDVKQVIAGGSEGPVLLVMRRTFDGLAGKGVKDTIDRYALNTLRRIDQTEISSDAVTSYPRIGDLSPSGELYAFEHPVGRLSVQQLGSPMPVVDGLELMSTTDDKDAKHSGIAAIYFVTDEKIAIVTKSGVVETWDLESKKRVGATEPFPVGAGWKDRRSLAFHRDRDPDKSQVFAFAGGAIHSVVPGRKPQLALALPNRATECLALAVDASANRITVAYRASDPGEHIRFLHARVGDPSPSMNQQLHEEVGLPILAEWNRPETFTLITDKGLGLAWDADTNQLIAGFRSATPTILIPDGTRHWCLLADRKDAKKSLLVNVSIPPEDYSPSLTGEKWKALALTINAEGTLK